MQKGESNRAKREKAQQERQLRPIYIEGQREIHENQEWQRLLRKEEERQKSRDHFKGGSSQYDFTGGMRQEDQGQFLGGRSQEMLQGRNSQEKNLLDPSHGFGSNMVKQEKESPSNQTWGNKYEKPRQYRNNIPGNSSTNANLVPLGSKSRSSRGGDSWHADPRARSSVEREKLWERGRAEKERQLRELQEKQAKVQPGDRGAEEDSCWQKWLDALEDEKIKLEKLWRGGVIGVEE